MSTPVEKMRNKSHSESITKSVTSNSTITILVVDDDTACLAIVAALLKKFQYEVLTVKHARDALCTLRVKRGYFDLVVTDVHMPDMNGFELQQIIAREFDLPVILMSVDDKEGVALKGLDGGAAYFIAKPVCPDDVRDLWQFASMKKKTGAVIEKNDNGSFPGEEISSHKILAFASSMNGDKHNNKDLDRRFPRKEDFDEKRGEKCEVFKKKRKLIWTNSLHNRFLEAIRSIGFDRAVPKKILEVMNVPGLTRENVASHLQKYRIFLKKVSDAASFQVHYSNNNDKRGLTSRSYNPSFTSSSIPYFDRFSRLHNLTPRNYPNSFISPSFTNHGASSSSSLIPQSRLFGQPRLLTNRATFPRQIFAGNATNLINQSHRALARFGQNMNYQTNTSYTFQGQLSNISLENIFSSSRNVPTENTSLTHKYVGLEISSLKRLVEQGNNKKHDSVMNVPSHHNDHEYQNNSTNVISAEGMVNDPRMNFDQLVRHLEGSNPPSPFNLVDAGNAGGKELTDVIADYQMLLPTNVENNGGDSNIHQQSCHSSPLFDLSDFGISSSPLHDMEEGGVNSSLPNQLNHENQHIGGENVPSPGFYGIPNHWANNVPSIEQAQGEQKGIDHNVFYSSHELGEPSQLHTTPLPNFNEQGQKSLINSVEFAGTSSKLKKDPISSNEREDDDFLESLMAPSPYGEDQTPEGI